MEKKKCILIACFVMLFVAGCFDGQTLDSKTTDNLDDVYIFVQLTDNHLGYKPLCVPVTRKVIEEINRYKAQRPIDFIALTGDLVRIGKYDLVMEDYKAIEKTSKYPIYEVTGNTEFGPDKSTNIDVENVEKCGQMWKEHFGELNYCVDIRDVKFVFVSSQNLIYDFNIDECDVYQWLETQLKEAKRMSKDVIIFTHKPIFMTYYKGKMGSSYPDKKYERLRTLVNDYNVNAIIAGHFHREVFHWVGDVPVYVCPASVDFQSGIGRFRVYEYNLKSNRMSYSTFEVK